MFVRFLSGPEGEFPLSLPSLLSNISENAGIFFSIRHVRFFKCQLQSSQESIRLILSFSCILGTKFNKLTYVFYASVLLLIINFVITLSK